MQEQSINSQQTASGISRGPPGDGVTGIRRSQSKYTSQLRFATRQKALTMTTSAQRIDWLFGRGLSISCNLSWVVPSEWTVLDREVKIARIQETLRIEMDRSTVDCSIVTQLLRILEQHTVAGWRNLFITTNWDYLLQREILSLDLVHLPPWLANSHVFHINGTIEVLRNNDHRSPFLLEQDLSAQRYSTTEANKAFSWMIENRTFVVIGMSFECETDKFLLSSLARIEDDFPIGESEWIIVNPDHNALQQSCFRIQSALPHATVIPVQKTLSVWLEEKLPELQSRGALAF